MFQAPQQQRVGHYRHGGEGHSQAGQLGFEGDAEGEIEEAGGHRDAEDVVEEGPKQVLLDLGQGGPTQPDGPPIKIVEACVTLKQGRNAFDFADAWRDAIPWFPANPQLYGYTVTLARELFERRSEIEAFAAPPRLPARPQAAGKAADRQAGERLARYVRSLRVEIAGPLTADSLSALLGLIR